MTNPYTIRTLMLASGERLPVLLDRETGFPLVEPTLYSVTEIRARNQASNTLEQVLRSILVFQLFLDLRHIDLDERLRQGQVLELGEIDELVRLCRLPVELLVAQLTPTPKRHTPPRVTSLEPFRLHPTVHLEEVSASTAANRVRVIRDFLNWLVKLRLSRLTPCNTMYGPLLAAGEMAQGALNARVAGLCCTNPPPPQLGKIAA
ncbi:hypothetical protein PWG14_06110 (plasmid) [Chromobacterium amazonense]|uniref:hypothetical protein n=1 Tax=Chromobacterium amazonense TaxID=1382803 RepID=UPI00237DD3FE|nr:hypothetical protein [Chromobacterium amazonense]MDE1712307.1 hypothetical protein [Chromobacterium amazonense]